MTALGCPLKGPDGTLAARRPRHGRVVCAWGFWMAVVSAGVLLYRKTERGLEVLLVHPGGPFWRKRDLGAWSIPKGEVNAGEELEAAARREFQEELGSRLDAPLEPLGRVRQRGGKIVEAFAAEGDFEVAGVKSISFEMEWPPRSGRRASFPEVDRAEWFTLAGAREQILEGQAPLLDILAERLS
jgi:predicted NUDIX family NTP pyrophosphohydrolase